MRHTLTTLAALLALTTFVLADAEKEKQYVRAIPLADMKHDGGDAKKPTVITTAEELEKAIPDKDVREGIAEKVDLTKEVLVLFRWAGSGGDKIIPQVETTEDKSTAVHFYYSRGRTRDLRHHTKLFAVTKEVKWQVKDAPI